MPSVRVLLADSDPAARADVRRLLETHGYTVVAEAVDGRQALRLAQALAPDVLVVEAKLSGLTTTEVTRLLREEAVPVPVLVLSARLDAPLAPVLLQAGVAGYLTREETPERIAAAALGVAQGEKRWFSPAVVARLRRLRSASAPVPLLSPREMDVLGLFAWGLEGQQIADELGISPGTARLHVEHILEKLGAHTRAHAVAIAYSRGLLTPWDDLLG